MHNNLDLLRACAVLLVVACHLLGNGYDWFSRWPAIPHAMGRAGVMIFFVHTSLVLMMSMERMGARCAKQLFASFYIRRLFRIYPLSLFTVVMVCLIGAFWQASAEPFTAFTPHTWREVISNSLLVHNLTQEKSTIGPLWSLPYEVQMYAVLPVIYLAVRRGRIQLVVTCAIAVALVNAAALQAGIRAARVLDYVPCFLAGVAAYLSSKRWPRRVSAKLWPVCLAGIVVLYVSSGLGWPARKVFYPEWAICWILGTAIPLFADIKSRAIAFPSHVIAKYSYGIYLFHVPALWLAFDVFRLGVIAATILFVAITAGASACAFLLIEDPAIRLGKAVSGRLLALPAFTGPDIPLGDERRTPLRSPQMTHSQR